MKYLYLLPTSLYDAESYEKALKAAYDKDIFKVVKGLDKVIRSVSEKLSNGKNIEVAMSDNAAKRLGKIIRSNPDLFAHVRASSPEPDWHFRNLFVSAERLGIRQNRDTYSEHGDGLEWLASLGCIKAYLSYYPLFEGIHTSEIEPGMYDLSKFEEGEFSPLEFNRTYEEGWAKEEFRAFCGEDEDEEDDVDDEIEDDEIEDGVDEDEDDEDEGGVEPSQYFFDHDDSDCGKGGA